MKRIIKNNLLGFIIGAIVFSSIGIVAATTLGPSDYWFKTTKNSNVENVEDALDDLYSKTVDLIDPQPLKDADFEYKYWNDDIEGNEYYLFEAPDNIYATRAALETAYGSSNFANNPIYIRSAFKENTAVYHEACFYHATTGKEFCLAPNYWVGDSQDQTDGSTTKAKLKADMEAALGITIASGDCYSASSIVYCDVGDFGCGVDPSGDVSCYSSVMFESCCVDVDGDAYCD